MRIFIAIFAAVMSSSAMAQTVEYTELDDAQTKAVVEHVGAELKDPYSAHYLLPALPDMEAQGSDGLSVWYCGCVNSKNSYGGYVGFTPFYGMFLTPEATKEGWGFLFSALADHPHILNDMCTTRFAFEDFSCDNLQIEKRRQQQE